MYKGSVILLAYKSMGPYTQMKFYMAVNRFFLTDLYGIYKKNKMCHVPLHARSQNMMAYGGTIQWYTEFHHFLLYRTDVRVHYTYSVGYTVDLYYPDIFYATDCM